MENSLLDDAFSYAEEELNTSWTNEYSRTLYSNTSHSTEPMESISLHFLFVNTHFELYNKSVEKVDLEILDNDQGSLLKEGILLQLLEQYRNRDGKRFKCDQILQFFVDTKPDLLFRYLDDEKTPFQESERMKILDIPRSITLPPCSFLFHSLNSIWIIMQELVPIEQPVRSILKKNDHQNVGKKTKRVRIGNHLPKRHSKTHKRLSHTE